MTEPVEISLHDRLAGLAAWVERLEDPAFSPGRWVPSELGADGTIHLGWYERSAAAEAFHADCGRFGWIEPFDWMAWLETPVGRRLADDPAAVAGASVEDLRRLLTAIIRSDRFSEGSLAGAFESGTILAVARRAAVLLAALDERGSDAGAPGAGRPGPGVPR